MVELIVPTRYVDKKYVWPKVIMKNHFPNKFIIGHSVCFLFG